MNGSAKQAGLLTGQIKTLLGAYAGFAALRGECPMNCGLRVRLDRIGSALDKDIRRIDEIWTEGLVRYGGPYLAGPVFSAVDAFAPFRFSSSRESMMPTR